MPRSSRRRSGRPRVLRADPDLPRPDEGAARRPRGRARRLPGGPDAASRTGRTASPRAAWSRRPISAGDVEAARTALEQWGFYELPVNGPVLLPIARGRYRLAANGEVERGLDDLMVLGERPGSGSVRQSGRLSVAAVCGGRSSGSGARRRRLSCRRKPRARAGMGRPVGDRSPRAAGLAAAAKVRRCFASRSRQAARTPDQSWRSHRRASGRRPESEQPQQAISFVRASSRRPRAALAAGTRRSRPRAPARVP